MTNREVKVVWSAVAVIVLPPLIVALVLVWVYA